MEQVSQGGFLDWSSIRSSADNSVKLYLASSGRLQVEELKTPAGRTVRLAEMRSPPYFRLPAPSQTALFLGKHLEYIETILVWQLNIVSMSPVDQSNERLEGDDLEVGYTVALRKHLSRHVHPAPPVSQKRLDFEHRRPRLFQECVAEALGTFFYV